MKRSELARLRELVQEEKLRRQKVRELLKIDVLKEYLSNNTSLENIDSEDLKSILSKILSTFEITQSNGIYVCTSAWVLEYSQYSYSLDYFVKEVEIASPIAEFKTYMDIETSKAVGAVLTEQTEPGKPLIRNFERNNIVLNPHNNYEHNMNGFNEVRFDFFETALKEGQHEAKRLIISKYPQIETN